MSKRPHDDVAPDGQPSGDVTILAFQHRAMVRRVAEARLEVEAAQSNAARAEHASRLARRELAVLDKAWHELDEDMQVLLGRIGGGKGKVAWADWSSASSGSFVAKLGRAAARAVDEDTAADEEAFAAEVQALVDKRLAFTMGVAGKLVEALGKGGAAGGGDAEALHVRHRELTSALAASEARVAELSAGQAEMQAQVDEALEKAKKLARHAATPLETPNAKKAKTEAASGGAGGASAGGDGGKPVDSEELAAAQREVDELRIERDMKEQRLASLDEEAIATAKRVAELEVQLKSATAIETIQSTAVYMALFKAYSLTNVELATSREEHEKLRAEVATLQETRRSELTAADQAIEGRIASLRQQLAEADQQTAQLRAEIDQLKAAERDAAAKGDDAGPVTRAAYQKLVDEVTASVKALEKQMSERAAQPTGSEDVDAMVAEMEAIANAFQESQEQNSDLLAKLGEQEALNHRLRAESARIGEERDLVKKQQTALMAKVKSTEQKASAVSELNVATEARLSAANKTLAALQKESSAASAIAELEKSRTRSVQSELELTKSQFKATQAALENVKTSTGENSAQVAQLKSKLDIATNQMRMAERKFASLKASVAGGGGDPASEEELSTYRKLFTCQVCHVRQKDVVITKCFHCFCGKCIQTRLDNRDRKCPGCAKPFGADDVSQFYL